MRKSIFYKYFSITAAILFVSFIVLGGILMMFSRNQWTSSKKNLLSNNVRTVSEISSEALTSGAGIKGQISDTVAVIARIIDADIYITDEKGNTVMCSHGDDNCNHKQAAVKSDIMTSAISGDRIFTGNMGGVYSGSCYTVSTPVYYQNIPVGAVFASVPMADAYNNTVQVFKVLLLCSVFVLFMAFVAIYIASAQMTRPLRQMAQAASNMEKGNFVQIVPTSAQDEVGLLVDAFNKMSKSLGSLENMRRSFISSVSHELKTPMTTISGFVDGMLDGTIPPENYDKYLHIVSDETKRLSRLVNSMLQLSRLENDEVKLSISRFNVTEMVVRILLSFEHRINEKSIDIRGLDECPAVMIGADFDLMYQVIYNLVENAIKFTPEGGYISLGISVDKHGGAELYIQNSGEGLTGIELSRIFERFYKTDRSRSRDKTGMGFGLYIVKTIVGLHGGKIVASSVQGEYTRFDVSIPNHELQADNLSSERS